MDNSLIAEQIVSDVQKLPRQEAILFVKQTLDQLSSLFSAEEGANVKVDNVVAKNFIASHKPFLISMVHKIGQPCMGGYRLVLGYNPSDNEIFIEKGEPYA